jgi:POT family proton-dependent oligopeptide transporter
MCCEKTSIWSIPPEILSVWKRLQKKREATGTIPSVKYTLKEIVLWIVVAGGLFALFIYLFKGDLIGAFIYTAALVVPAFVISDKSLTKIERQRIWVIYIIAFFVIFFWSALSKQEYH